jgi:spermidine synthase
MCDMHEHTSEFHHITVEDIGQLRILRFERNRQSSMYLDAPFDTDFEYPSYFHLGIAVKPDAMRTCVVGLGGGTVVKRMWRDYPEMTLDVVELDPDVVDVAHEFFELPEDDRIRIHVADGRDFMEWTADTFDLVIVDAFDDFRVPRPLTTEEFMHAVRERLAPDGVVVYNVIGSVRGNRSRPFRSLYRTMRNVWRQVWLFVVDEGVGAEGDNLILVATDEPPETEELLRRIASRVDGRVTVPAFDLFGNDLYTEPIRLGDVPIITDPPGSKRG